MCHLRAVLRATSSSRLGRRGFAAAFLAVAFAGNAAQAGLGFNVSYDPSVDAAPADFKSAFGAAIQFLQANYSDPITINIHVGWGEINGGNLSPGNLGQSLTNQQGSYYYSVS